MVCIATCWSTPSPSPQAHITPQMPKRLNPGPASPGPIRAACIVGIGLEISSPAARLAVSKARYLHGRNKEKEHRTTERGLWGSMTDDVVAVTALLPLRALPLHFGFFLSSVLIGAVSSHSFPLCSPSPTVLPPEPLYHNTHRHRQYQPSQARFQSRPNPRTPSPIISRDFTHACIVHSRKYIYK